jgi:hypothetical protein
LEENRLNLWIWKGQILALTMRIFQKFGPEPIWVGYGLAFIYPAFTCNIWSFFKLAIKLNINPEYLLGRVKDVKFKNLRVESMSYCFKSPPPKFEPQI